LKQAVPQQVGLAVPVGQEWQAAWPFLGDPVALAILEVRGSLTPVELGPEVPVPEVPVPEVPVLHRPFHKTQHCRDMPVMVHF